MGVESKYEPSVKKIIIISLMIGNVLKDYTTIRKSKEMERNNTLSTGYIAKAVQPN